MKVLIVDDEEHVREAIELSVDWGHYGIDQRLLASNGAEALELLREHRPEVMFCDMSMPRMDGTELLQRIREENENVQVIVISGHDDFRYTQAAIRAFGIDYLLKPFRRADLEKALEKAISVWEEKESLRSGLRESAYRMKQVDAMLEEQRLAGYLRGEIAYHDGIRPWFRKWCDTEQLWVALMLPRNQLEIINRRLDGDAELYAFAVSNIVDEVLHSCRVWSFCRLDAYQWVLLIGADSQGADGSMFQLYVRRISAAWERTFGLTVFTGLCEEKTIVKDLPGALGSARVALLKSPVLPGSAAPSGPAPRLSEQQQLLEAALQSGNRSYAAELIQSFVRSVRQRGALTLKELQAYTLEANLMLDRAGGHDPAGRELPGLQLPLWINDLEEWGRLLLQQWWRLMEESGSEGGGSRGVEAMREYMNGHYYEDISLSSLSERFHFSPQYISKKFKEMYNTTVVTYLTELRMEKAASLLSHTEMTVHDIAQRVGYGDENYFGKVFKKHTGFSPLQYRKQRPQQEAHI
ncbi:response regulator [Paenibacillus sp. F411]|uniref:response regulator n=1 Tax=Paenibacillus sp. F411 TaxID=2820239 RepID=UPI001AAECE6A|nr:response regulator [Paenibacillus sp. F411]MBO2944598.1 response regulator [Paenibacillus sp. F411]